MKVYVLVRHNQANELEFVLGDGSSALPHVRGYATLLSAERGQRKLGGRILELDVANGKSVG